MVQNWHHRRHTSSSCTISNDGNLDDLHEDCKMIHPNKMVTIINSLILAVTLRIDAKFLNGCGAFHYSDNPVNKRFWKESGRVARKNSNLSKYYWKSTMSRLGITIKWKIIDVMKSETTNILYVRGGRYALKGTVLAVPNELVAVQ